MALRYLIIFFFSGIITANAQLYTRIELGPSLYRIDHDYSSIPSYWAKWSSDWKQTVLVPGVSLGAIIGNKIDVNFALQVQKIKTITRDASAYMVYEDLYKSELLTSSYGIGYHFGDFNLMGGYTFSRNMNERIGVSDVMRQKFDIIIFSEEEYSYDYFKSLHGYFVTLSRDIGNISVSANYRQSFPIEVASGRDPKLFFRGISSFEIKLGYRIDLLEWSAKKNEGCDID